MRNVLERWRRRRPGWIGRSWARHPRLAMALRASLAAAIAWYVGQAMPGPVGDYPYYAPMGAAMATSYTLAGSVRESAQAVASIALGAVIALAVDTVGGPNALGVAVVVAIAVLAAGIRLLGSMSSWVVTGAIFTLVFGHGNPGGFVGAFAGLTAVGAAIGLAVTWAMPALPLAPAQESMMRVRATLVNQLSDLADGLDRDTPPDADEWAERRRSLQPRLATMSAAVEDAEEARVGNRRVRRYQAILDYSVQQSRALEHVTFLVEDLTSFLVSEERAEKEHVALGPELRPPAARALKLLSDALGSARGASVHSEDHAAACAALDDLVREIERVRPHYPGDALLDASAIATNIRRCLEAVAPDDAEESSES